MIAWALLFVFSASSQQLWRSDSAPGNWPTNVRPILNKVQAEGWEDVLGDITWLTSQLWS